MQKSKIRNLLANDLVEVKKLHDRSAASFSFPDFSNNLYCCNKVVEDERGNIIGVGIVRLTSESILILDKTRERTTRSCAIKMLIDRMKKEVKSLGMDETHVFISNDNRALKSLLCRHFGFVPCKDRSLFLQF